MILEHFLDPPNIPMQLNQRAAELCDRLVAEAERLRVDVTTCESGARLIDCGIAAPGGLEAGLAMARICLAELGTVEIVPAEPELWQGPAVQVMTDHPTAACMASQYAGWQIAEGKFFAMGSGPMRAAAGREELFEKIPGREEADVAVGVLETAKIPPADVCRHVAERCGVEPNRLTLLLARTASQAGTLQVVARSIETALHKLIELGFDLSRVESGLGTAPLPPVAGDDLAGIGRTNDAILYGGQVTLWVRGDDASLEEIGPKIPSCASADHGRPFAEIFEQYDHDFYKIDPHLFSPAVVTLANLDTGRLHRFGHTLPRVIHQSFGP
jgi:methenyltetrahydromethanopterin cyclohydrolase